MKTLKVAYLLLGAALSTVAVAGCAGPVDSVAPLTLPVSESPDETSQVPVDFTQLVETDNMLLFLVTGDRDLLDIGAIPGFDDTSTSFETAYLGQANGLLGAANADSLTFSIATALGEVPVHVKVVDEEPELGDWEEIVEASFTPKGPDAVFASLEWTSDRSFSLASQSYRVRWSASGMDEAWDGVADENDPALDSYELVFWPAPEAPDAIIRETSEVAKYAHDDIPTKDDIHLYEPDLEDEPQQVE